MAVLLSRSSGRGYRVQCAGPYGEFSHVVNCFLMWVFSGCDGILSCSDWHKIALSFPLHIACNFERYATHRTPPLFAVCCQVMLHTAHRHSLLSAARSSSIRRHLAQSSTVHVESSDTMRSRRAQCQAPSHNPETGGTYHSWESRSCAGEKIGHHNEYKRHISSSAGMYVYKRG